MAIIYLCFCIWYTTNSGANKQKQLYVFRTVCFCFRISCSVSSVLVQILLSGSHSSPDMAFLLIDIQHYPCLTGKGGIKLHKTLCHVFMYGRYDFEPFCFQQIHLQSVSFHPAPDLPEVSDKYLRFRPCPPRSSGLSCSAACSSSGAHP